MRSKLTSVFFPKKDESEEKVLQKPGSTTLEPEAVVQEFAQIHEKVEAQYQSIGSMVQQQLMEAASTHSVRLESLEERTTHLSKAFVAMHQEVSEMSKRVETCAAALVKILSSQSMAPPVEQQVEKE